MITRILSIVFLIAAIILAYVLVTNIKSKVDEDARIKRQEELVIKKLQMIRDAEVAYLNSNGKYTADFDTLINFIDTGKIYIIQRREEIKPLAYGREESTFFYDTIGSVPVKDSVFVLREALPSLANGTVRDLNVSVGSRVARNDVIATIMSSTGKPVNVYAPTNCTIERLNVQEGDEVKLNESLGLIASKRINDINNLPYLPESETNEKFELFAGKITKGNVVVDVFEAVDTNPVNPSRRKNKNENALRVGSRTEVSVSGNWDNIE
jgi:uncharacterized protein (UPF0333 family)